MASSTKSIVCLNVGGTKYDVAKSTIDRYPNTMLARLVSNTWQEKEENKSANEEKQKNEFFIDGDGLQFRFVLEYMRHNKVDLPMNISKDSILKELKYYGFEDVCFDAIRLFGGASIEAAKHVVMCEKEFQDKKQALKDELDLLEVAHRCYKGYISSHGQTNFPLLSQDEVHFPHMRSAETHKMSAEKLAVFNKYLSEYGLRYVHHGSNQVKVEICGKDSV